MNGKNPQRASVRAETRIYCTDSPSRQKSHALPLILFPVPLILFPVNNSCGSLRCFKICGHSVNIRLHPGFDCLPPRILKLCPAGIAKSLCVLFNRSFSDGCFPSAWKSALVVPVFKKGARDSPSNYRPIALLPIVSKAMERIVHNKLYSFLQPWFNQHQSGFKKDGTVAQLIRLVQEWSESLDRSEYVDLVFFD